jgi:pimeloyl-ACP methyl ester carboxylesterase
MRRPLAKTLTLTGGLELDYAESGDRAGAPLVLLHGDTGSRRSYGRLMAALPPWVRAIALSLRGGDSATELATDVGVFLDAIALERAVVLGHSRSSAVARALALAAPERVAGLVIVGPLVHLGPEPEHVALRAPALVVWGEHDAGPAPHWDRPAEVAASIAAFAPLRALSRMQDPSNPRPELEPR